MTSMTLQRMERDSHLLTVKADDSLLASSSLSILSTENATDTLSAEIQLGKRHLI